MSKAYEFPIGDENVEKLIEKIKDLRNEIKGLAKDAGNAGKEVDKAVSPSGSQGARGKAPRMKSPGGPSVADKTLRMPSTPSVFEDDPTLQFKPSRRRNQRPSSGMNQPSISAPANPVANNRQPLQAPSQSVPSQAPVAPARIRAGAPRNPSTPAPPRASRKPQSSIARALRRTRFPLPGMHVLGTDLEMLLGPMGGPVAAAALAANIAKQGYQASIEAAEIQDLVGRTYRVSGGTPEQAAASAAISHNPRRPLNFGDQIRQGSYGAAWARSQGIVDLGPFTPNKSGNYINAIRKARQIKDPNMKMRVARDLFDDDEIAAIYSSKSAYQRLEGSYNQLASEKGIERTNDYLTNTKALSNSLDAIKMRVLGPALPGLTDLVGGLSDIFKPFDMNDIGGSIKDKAKTALSNIINTNPLTQMVKYTINGWDGLLNPKTSTPKPSTQNFEGDFRSPAREMSGGGSRANNAIPIDMNFNASVSDINRQVNRMGPY